MQLHNIRVSGCEPKAHKQQAALGKTHHEHHVIIQVQINNNIVFKPIINNK